VPGARPLATLPKPLSSAPNTRPVGIEPNQPQPSDRALFPLTAASPPNPAALTPGSRAAIREPTVLNGTRHVASPRPELAPVQREGTEAPAAGIPHASNTTPAGEVWTGAASPAHHPEPSTAAPAGQTGTFESTDAALPSFVRPAKRELPRLHIGSIEVRVAQPPPPVPASPAPTMPAPAAPAAPAAAPIARPYASRFGLGQG
jgi:hypothetical protein